MEYREAAALGDVGERRVSEALRSEAVALGSRVLDNLLLVDDRTTAQIDHLVIDRFGILVVETKNYRALIRGKSDDTRWTACYSGARRHREQFLNPLRQNDRHREMIHRMLGAHGLALPASYVQNLVVFAGGELKALNLDDADSMRVIREWDVADYLRARSGDFPPNPGALDDEQVANLVSTLKSVNQASDPEATELHADNVHRATRRWVRKRPASRPTPGSASPSTPYVTRHAFGSAERYPDGSPMAPRRRMSKTSRQALFLCGFMLVLTWFSFGGGSRWFISAVTPLIVRTVIPGLAQPQTPRVPQTTGALPVAPVTYDVALALSALRDASPSVYARLANPQAPSLSTTQGLPTYTWQYVARQHVSAAQVKTVSITIDGGGRIVGVTGVD